MSGRFKVGDLVVRNPEARGESGWPYGDSVCRVLGQYPNPNYLIVFPVSPKPSEFEGRWARWWSEKFTPANMTPMAEEHENEAN